MTDAHSFLEEPEGTQEAIMTATYHALCEHGYAGLTIQRIAEHFEKSKSLLYHHYDSKDELLLDFLEFMLDEFERSMPSAGDRSADERLDDVLDAIIAPDGDLPTEKREFTRAMVELRAQAAHDGRYREHFTRSDQFFRERLADVVREGIDAGVFRDVDAEGVAAFLLTVINGVMTERATADGDVAASVRAEVDAYVESRLRAEDASESERGGEST